MMSKERISKPVYPRMDRDSNKNVKISKKEYPRIRRLRERGLTYKQICEQYRVSISSIYCILNPDYYEKTKKKSNACHRKRWETDGEFRVKHARTLYASRKERLKEDPEFAEYHRLKDRYRRQEIKLREAGDDD